MMATWNMQIQIEGKLTSSIEVYKEVFSLLLRPYGMARGHHSLISLYENLKL